MMKPHKTYIRRLRKMKPEQRLMIALQLSELVRDIARQAIWSSDKGLSRREVEDELWKRIGR